MKPTVKETIIEYSNNKASDVQVYGSNALRMQMGKYLSGAPKDLEVHVDSEAKFAEVFRKNAKKHSVVSQITAKKSTPQISKSPVKMQQKKKASIKK